MPNVPENNVNSRISVAIEQEGKQKPASQTENKVASSEYSEKEFNVSSNEASFTSSVENLKRSKSLWGKASRIQKELVLFVIVPTLLVFFYTSFCWSPMYISETKFAVRSGSEQPLGFDLSSQFLKTTNTYVQDAEVVEAYIRSPDIFSSIDKELKITEHFSDSRWDILSRLSSEPTLWDKQAFWNWVSNPVVNLDNGIVTYTIRAYEPEMAHKIAVQVLNHSELLVNEMNERARKDSLAKAEEEVRLAQEKIAKTQKALVAFKNEHSDIDPQATATGLQSIVMGLESERARLKAEIKEARSYMKADAPQLETMKSRLQAIESQLRAEKSRLVNEKDQVALNSWVSEYETLMLENEFAKSQLTTAMTAMEAARASLLSKSRYIVPIEQPTMPDESRYPKAWIFTLSSFLGLLLIYGLVRLIIASIKEHAGF